MKVGHLLLGDIATVTYVTNLICSKEGYVQD